MDDRTVLDHTCSPPLRNRPPVRLLQEPGHTYGLLPLQGYRPYRYLSISLRLLWGSFVVHCTGSPNGLAGEDYRP